MTPYMFTLCEDIFLLLVVFSSPINGTLHRYHPVVEFFLQINNKIIVYCLYIGLFLPHVILALLHLETVPPHLEFAQTHLTCLKRDITRHWNSPSLKFTR